MTWRKTERYKENLREKQKYLCERDSQTNEETGRLKLEIKTERDRWTDRQGIKIERRI